jgi:hypothetical protein
LTKLVFRVYFSMQNLTRELLDLWYELIGGDHHKDRDCHFYIERNFSTYKESKWRFYHCGYLLDEIEEFYETYKEAEKGLQKLLAEKIKEFCETDPLEERCDREVEVLKKLNKLLEGNDSPADEPSNSERR